MRKLPFAAAILAAMITMSALFAYAEQQEGSEPAKQSTAQSVLENIIQDFTRDSARDAKKNAAEDASEEITEDNSEEASEADSEETTEADSDDFEEDAPEDSTGEAAEEAAQEIEHHVADESMYYYRTRLSEEEQIIYDILLACCLSEDPSERGEGIELYMDPASDDFHMAFRRSYNALIFDHPELFWLSVSGSSFQFSYRRKLFDSDCYLVAFQTNKTFPDKDAQMAELERAADEFLDEIDLTEPDPQVALAIHDKLIGLVTYDIELARDMGEDELIRDEDSGDNAEDRDADQDADQGTDQDEDRDANQDADQGTDQDEDRDADQDEDRDADQSDAEQANDDDADRPEAPPESVSKDLGHTAYGALVENSRGDANTAVCDGYTYAYAYLLQKAGIRCLVITGKAGNSEETAGNHSWNLVELDDEWYEVDATWDDMTVEEMVDSEEEYSEIAEEAIHSDWYMNKLKHFMFNVTSEESSFFDPDESYRYTTDRGWVTFLGSSVHIRHTEEDSPYTGDYMTPIAPIAEGTQYAYEKLID